MFNFFKKKPKYKVGPQNSYCAIQFVRGHIEPKLRIRSTDWGYETVESDLNAMLLWAASKHITPKNPLKNKTIEY